MAFYRLLVTLPLFVSLRACIPFTRTPLSFQDAQHGQPLSNTSFDVSLQREIQPLSAGRPVQTDTLSLIHRETGEAFPVSQGHLFLVDEKSENLKCQDCIQLLERNGNAYVLTQFHGGGSGGFYMHHLFKLQGKEAISVNGYSSCGSVYLDDDLLIFSSHEYQCPELFFSLNSGRENIETFSLSN